MRACRMPVFRRGELDLGCRLLSSLGHQVPQDFPKPSPCCPCAIGTLNIFSHCVVQSSVGFIPSFHRTWSKPSSSRPKYFADLKFRPSEKRRHLFLQFVAIFLTKFWSFSVKLRPRNPKALWSILVQGLIFCNKESTGFRNARSHWVPNWKFV